MQICCNVYWHFKQNIENEVSNFGTFALLSETQIFSGMISKPDISLFSEFARLFHVSCSLTKIIKTKLEFSCNIRVFLKWFENLSAKFAYFFHANNLVKNVCNIYLYFEQNHERKLEILTVSLFCVKFNFFWNNFKTTQQLFFKSYIPPPSNVAIVLCKFFVLWRKLSSQIWNFDICDICEIQKFYRIILKPDITLSSKFTCLFYAIRR